MLFDARAELPVATLRTRSPGSRWLAGLQGRLRWIRPRLVPIVAAIAGTTIVGIGASYLFGLTQPTPETARATQPALTAPAPAAVHVALSPSR